MDEYIYQLIRAIVMLGAVIVVMVLILYGMRFLMWRSGGRKDSVLPVKVITTAFLGQKKNIAVVDVAGEVLILGITPTTITRLGRIENKEVLERIKEMHRHRVKTFSELLGEGLRGMGFLQSR